jgi:hypothetical protein
MLIPALATAALLHASILSLPTALSAPVDARMSAKPAAPAAPATSGGKPARVAAPALPAEWVVPTAGGFRMADGLHAALRAHDAAEATLVVPVAEIGEVRLRLRRFTGVAPSVRVEVGSTKRVASAELTEALRGVAHFEGVVESVAGNDQALAGSSCYLGIGATGAAGWINLGSSDGHFMLRRVGSDAPGLCAGEVAFVRTSGTAAPDAPSCGGIHFGEGAGEGGTAGLGAVPPGVLKVVDMAFDTDFEYYRIFGNTYAATEYLGVLTGAISAIYRRDCDATIAVAYVRLQTNEADLFNEPDPLGAFRTYWTDNGASVDRDLFTFITGRRNLPYGGVAYLNAGCQSFGYSVNGYINGTFVAGADTNPGCWDVNVVAHEWGHNLGTYHTHDYGIDGCASGAVQRGTIMSYCHTVSGASSNIDLRFHRGTAEAIEAFLAGAPCLGSDCDGDGFDDAEEIALAPSLDTNLDGVLDACQDCNGNGQPDPVEILLGLVGDSDGDLLPDPCETDCDGDGLADSFEIALDANLDKDGDMRLDACQTDCDGDGTADAVEIIADMSLDRSRDGRLDACEDCDGDGVTDFAELRGSRSRWVASASDTLLRELDPRSGVLRRTVATGTDVINDLAIAADGRLAIAAGPRVLAFDRVAGAAPVAWSPVLAAEARSVAVTPDGRMAVLLANGAVVLLDATGAISSTFVAAGGPPAGTPFDLVFRTAPGGATELLVSYTAGVIRSYPWNPSGSAGSGAVFADRSGTLPEFRGMFALADGSVLVASAALSAIVRFAADGAYLGEWDVENAALLFNPHSLCDAGDGRGVIATGGGSSSTINGYNRASGYTERTYRVYPSDAPAATAIVIAPASETDADGDLVPDECQAPSPDLNGDGLVNAADLALLLNGWGACVGCAGDLNRDGTVGAADLAIMLNAWS